jgi:predicted methyltransferase
LREIRADPSYSFRSDLDQCPATLSTVLRRATLLARHSRDLLLVGDDDLLGPALTVTGARERIVVLDADETLLQLIARHVPEHSIKLVNHDLRDGLPHHLRRRFDEVFTDPPYTLAGQLLFVHRALLALRDDRGAGLYVCASRAYLSVAELRAVRHFLWRAGFEPEAVYPAFNRYKAPADVRCDLKLRGWRCPTWLDSDLFHYVRRRSAPIPRIPTHICSSIYEYQTTSIT